MSLVVEAEGVSRSYRKTVAVSDVSFSISAGETVGLVGPNGAGKTTLMRILCGAIRPSAGEVRLFGEAPRGLSEPGRRLGFVLDPPGISSVMPTVDILRSEALAQRLPRSRVRDLIEEFSLAAFAHRRFGRLSLGQKQRVALAAANVGRPQLLILDEPTNGLDIEAIQWWRGFIRQRAEQGLSTIVSSHNLVELERVASRTLILNQTLRFDGSGLLGGSERSEERYLEFIGREAVR